MRPRDRATAPTKKVGLEERGSGQAKARIEEPFNRGSIDPITLHTNTKTKNQAKNGGKRNLKFRPELTGDRQKKLPSIWGTSGGVPHNGQNRRSVPLK